MFLHMFGCLFVKEFYNFLVLYKIVLKYCFSLLKQSSSANTNISNRTNISKSTRSSSSIVVWGLRNLSLKLDFPLIMINLFRLPQTYLILALLFRGKQNSEVKNRTVVLNIIELVIISFCLISAQNYTSLLYLTLSISGQKSSFYVSCFTGSLHWSSSSK